MAQEHPVRIAASAIAPGIPSRDLYVTSGHALLIDGILITAASLANRTSILQLKMDDREELEYFHIKLARHDAIYAEGAPCEALLKVTESTSNFADYLRRYGATTEEEAPFMPLFAHYRRRDQLCSRIRSAVSPWVDCRQQIDVIRDRLEDRAIFSVDG